MGNVDNVDWMADILGCEVSSMLLKCLGLPLGASYKVKHIWDCVIEKIERHLASWKMMYMSRVEGLSSSIAHFPTYLRTLYSSFLSCRCCYCIEKFQRDFLWGGLGEEFKYHLVS